MNNSGHYLRNSDGDQYEDRPFMERKHAMTLTDEQREQLLRFIYGDKIIIEGDTWGYTGKGDMRPIPTFTTVHDLHAVYSRMVEVGKWNTFFTERFNEWYVTAWMEKDEDEDAMFTAWLHCYHDPSQIGERMEMAGGWLGREA